MRVILLCALGATIVAAQTPARPAPGQTPARDRPARVRPSDVPEPERHARGVIRGRVVADGADNSAPIAKVRVELSREGTADWMFTDSSGLFEFSELPAGHYTLLADKSGYAPTRYGAAGYLDSPTVVELADGGREEIEIRLPKGAAIAGHVVDDLGDPLVGARLSLNAIRAEGTGRRLAVISQGPVETDDLGAFRVGGLPAGRYVLSVAARDRGYVMSFDSGGTPPPRRVGSGRTFYPSGATPGDATPIELKSGEERLDVDLAFTPFRPATLTVAVAGADAAGPRSMPPARVVFANQDTPDPVSQDSNVEFSGAVRPVALDPGRWDVIARRGVDGAIARVTLAPGETQSTVLEIRPAARFGGRLVFEGSPGRPDASAVYLDVIGAGSERMVSPLFLLPGGRVAAKPDGSFSLAGVLGTVEFLVTPPAGWAVSRFTAGDRDLLGTSMTFEGGETITDARIVLTDRVSEVNGSVLEADARPSAGCKVAVFPSTADAIFNRYRMRLVQADRAGRFSIRELPSGSYAVASTRDLDTDIWTAPESLARLRAAAVTVTLAEHETRSLALQCGGAQ